jgi:hypothetical protein
MYETNTWFVIGGTANVVYEWLNNVWFDWR